MVIFLYCLECAFLFFIYTFFFLQPFVNYFFFPLNRFGLYKRNLGWGKKKVLYNVNERIFIGSFLCWQYINKLEYYTSNLVISLFFMLFRIRNFGKYCNRTWINLYTSGSTEKRLRINWQNINPKFPIWVIFRLYFL